MDLWELPSIDPSMINSAKPSDMDFAESPDWLRLCNAQQNFFWHRFYFLLPYKPSCHKAGSPRPIRFNSKEDLQKAYLSARSSVPSLPGEAGTPPVVAHFSTALKWQRLLDSGRFKSRNAIARSEGISRARVTQLLSLLNLAPQIREYITSMPETSKNGRRLITEHIVRPITSIKDQREQIAAFERITGVCLSQQTA